MKTPSISNPTPAKLFYIVLLYVILLLLILAGLSAWLWNLSTVPYIMYVPVPILQWGFVGGMIAVLYRLAYRRSGPAKIGLYTWVIAKPIIGMVMGGLVYFVAVSGELFLNGQTQIQNIHFLNVLAFLGGFSDRFSIDLINRVASRTLAEAEEPEAKKSDETA